MRLKTGWLATQSARSWLIGLILAAVVVSLVAQWQQQRDWQQAYVRQQQASQRSGAAIIKRASGSRAFKSACQCGPFTESPRENQMVPSLRTP